ncbi:MAG: two-component system response regulator [Gemmatimonadetes bacterium]|nr:two-component system response regulator [Gemmatimonadota bacterium]
MATEPKTLLIVDDDRSLVDALTLYLDGFGYLIHKAYNGSAGERKARHKQPDVIILDIMLPDKDGYEVCQRLKRHRRTKHIPIVMLSAKSSVPDIDKGFRALADAYVTKPFDPARLHAKIKKLLNAEDEEEKKES